MPACNVKIWSQPILKAFEFAELDTPVRQAAFLAQCAVESAELTRLVENLNYGESALLRVFLKRFNQIQAKEYARRPERIANRAYAERYGNGSEASGDGYRYRGRGIIQLTFKDNYRACAAGTGIPCVVYPEYLERPEEAALSAAWYWKSRKINEAADAGDFAEVTRRVNSALLHISRRKEYYVKALHVLTQGQQSTIN